jgi:hypothetical protein
MPPAAPVITATCPLIVCILTAPPDGAPRVLTLSVSRPGYSMLIPPRAVRLRSSAPFSVRMYSSQVSAGLKRPQFLPRSYDFSVRVKGAVNDDPQGGQRAFDQILHAALRSGTEVVW